MFKSIYVPVDNSEFSNRAGELAVMLGEQFKSEITGSHVYAAAMHDYRFKQMEYTLPGEYLQEQEIERQRKIHDSLITMGLELISDCYLNVLGTQCSERGIELQRRMMDGKHHIELIKDIEAQSYDLTVMGVVGVGKTRASQIGSVCERVVRNCARDFWVVKHVPKERDVPRDTVLVAIDGSPQSFGALVRGIELAKRFDKRLEIISVYDPYLHYTVFNSIVDVLTEKAAKVFRFEEQNQLHEEVIDTGLAQIYQSHLNIAERMAEEREVEVSKTLLDGKAFHKILQRVEDDPPWVLILGRVGVHKLKDEDTGLGSTTENLLRMAPCDIFLNTYTEFPSLDTRAEETILWTDEAQARMQRVPDTVRGIARTGILRLAIEQGHSVVTEGVIEEAMDRFMPKSTAQRTQELAEALVLERAREQGAIAQCKHCGVSAAESDPSACSVCGGTEFNMISREAVEQVAQAQGGVEEESTYDGRKLGWSQEARRELNSIEDKYQKRRAKARIEKAARVQRLEVITYEFAHKVIEDDVGRDLTFGSYDPESDKRVVAVADDGSEIRSVYRWSDAAVQRLMTIPAGFMREKTQERTENVALEHQAQSIELEHVDAGIEVGRKVMEQVVQSAGFGAVSEDSAAAQASKAEGAKCPFSGMFASDAGKDRADLFKQVQQVYEREQAAQVDQAPGSSRALGEKIESHVKSGAVGQVLNEAGLMREIEKKRRELDESS